MDTFARFEYISVYVLFYELISMFRGYNSSHMRKHKYVIVLILLYAKKCSIGLLQIAKSSR